MAEEDFDIDFYGDENEAGNEPQQQQQETLPREDNRDNAHDYQDDGHNGADGDRMDEQHQRDDEPHDDGHDHEVADDSARQGTKRKSEEDDRPVDANATAAIMISELNWWTTDDDIRGWFRKAECEGEVKELTFSEHKVNGKSKGQAYVEFYTPQASTASKYYIDQLSADGGQLGQKKIATQFWNPGVNPFRTLPKDAPARVKEQPRAAPSGPHNERGNYSGGYRGRGGYNRGGMNQNFNRNFNGNAGGNAGFNNNNNNMGGFNGNMQGGGGNFGGFNGGGRGGMMGGGMRGGPGGMRGGRGGGMMPMNPMGQMRMGMPGNMGMGMMGPGNMPGFPGMPANFNSGFGFNQQQGGGNGGSGDWGNPHGAKRPRPE